MASAVTRSIGRYELLREIGRGGMAFVYLARQPDLDRNVALKELSASPPPIRAASSASSASRGWPGRSAIRMSSPSTSTSSTRAGYIAME